MCVLILNDWEQIRLVCRYLLVAANDVGKERSREVREVGDRH